MAAEPLLLRGRWRRGVGGGGVIRVCGDSEGAVGRRRAAVRGWCGRSEGLLRAVCDESLDGGRLAQQVGTARCKPNVGRGGGDGGSRASVPPSGSMRWSAHISHQSRGVAQLRRQLLRADLRAAAVDPHRLLLAHRLSRGGSFPGRLSVSCPSRPGSLLHTGQPTVHRRRRWPIGIRFVLCLAGAADRKLARHLQHRHVHQGWRTRGEELGGLRGAQAAAAARGGTGRRAGWLVSLRAARAAGGARLRLRQAAARVHVIACRQIARAWQPRVMLRLQATHESRVSILVVEVILAEPAHPHTDRRPAIVHSLPTRPVVRVAQQPVRLFLLQPPAAQLLLEKHLRQPQLKVGLVDSVAAGDLVGLDRTHHPARTVTRLDLQQLRVREGGELEARGRGRSGAFRRGCVQTCSAGKRNS
eukprot:scaffold1033_cov135-Isochrysis_galbana.AAC.3